MPALLHNLDLKALVNNINGIVWEADVKTFQFLFVSLQAELMLGYPLTEWYQKPNAWIKHLHPEDREKVLDHCLSLTHKKKNQDFEYRMIAADGRVLWLRNIVSVIVKNGEVPQLQGIMVDVTREKRIEAELNQTTSLLSSALESTADGLLIVDSSGRIVSHNDRFAQMWNIPSQVMAMGDDDTAIAHVLHQLNDPESFLKKIRELYQTPEADSVDKLEFKDGRVFERYSRPQRLDGVPIGRVWSFRDITEQERVKEDLKRLSQIKSEYVTVVTHELRTPLTCIAEGIRILMDGLDGPLNDEQTKTMQLAWRNVDRLNRTINHVLDFQKLDSGVGQANFGMCDLKMLFREVYQALRLQVEKAGLRFVLESPPTDVPAHCDKDLLEQLLINLVGNAIKYTPEGGAITIRLNQSAEEIRMQIVDTGIGISAVDQDRIFQMFARSLPPSSVQKRGFGVGLAICKKIAELHGGKIWVESTLGKGSLFTLTFPRELPAARSVLTA